MASKLQEYRRMSEEAQRQLTGSLERWQSFLATASRLYKYPYHEQVMIHAQRPDATALCGVRRLEQYDARYVRRGSKGIALIDTSGDRERLRYVFDVSDTGPRPNSRSLNLWERGRSTFRLCLHAGEKLRRSGRRKPCRSAGGCGLSTGAGILGGQPKGYPQHP